MFESPLLFEKKRKHIASTRHTLPAKKIFWLIGIVMV